MKVEIRRNFKPILHKIAISVEPNWNIFSYNRLGINIEINSFIIAHLCLKQLAVVVVEWSECWP